MAPKVRFIVCSAMIIAVALIAAFSLMNNTPVRAAATQGTATAAASTGPKGTLERGKYLVTVGGCVDCHGNPNLATDKNTPPPLAGGAEFALGPIGTYYAANLTILQAWSIEDFLKVFHQGLDPKENRVLAPIMPYAAYHDMADDDVASIRVYLQSLTPVKNEVPKAKIGPAAADALKPFPAQSVSMPAIDDSVAYGQYLTLHVTGCADCHSPRGADGGPMMDAVPLSGGGLNLNTEDSPIYASPIIGSVLDAEGYTLPTFKVAMTTGIRPWGSRIHPVMPYRTAYANLTENDLTAIWNYLNTLKLSKAWPTQAPATPDAASPAAATMAATVTATAAK